MAEMPENTSRTVFAMVIPARVLTAVAIPSTTVSGCSAAQEMPLPRSVSAVVASLTSSWKLTFSVRDLTTAPMASLRPFRAAWPSSLWLHSLNLLMISVTASEISFMAGASSVLTLRFRASKLSSILWTASLKSPSWSTLSLSITRPAFSASSP